MGWSWITTRFGDAAMAVVSAVGIYAALLVFTRVGGLRSFSKMSSFDFAVTVAMGSLLATTVVAPDPPLLRAVVALGALYALQLGLAGLRARRPEVSGIVDNEPLLLVRDGRVLEGALREARMTPADLRSKLREANVLRIERVRAVVMESTGDVSVLHRETDETLDAALLEGVRGAGGASPSGGSWPR